MHGYQSTRVTVHVCQADVTDHDAAIALRFGTDKGQKEIQSYQQRHKNCTPAYGPWYSPSALLMTCVQVHSEAALLPFTVNNFSFARSYDLQQFPGRLRVAQQKSISSIVIGHLTSPGGPNHLQRLTGVQDVTIFAERYGQELAQIKDIVAPRLPSFNSPRLTKAVVCVGSPKRGWYFNHSTGKIVAVCKEIEDMIVPSK